jgi:thioredoxin-dependent peroxiredoxin
MSGPQVGQQCPSFNATDMDGKTVSNIDLLANGPLVLYFYPKDETSVCTAQACGFRDDHQAFQEAGATVVGVSPDSPESHRNFASHHNLPFQLLSDPQKALFRLFGVSDSLGFLVGRETFVIDPKGTIQHRFRSQLFAKKHVDQALASVRKLKAC